MKLFGTDGIRGRWGQLPLTEEIAQGLGFALRKHYGAGVIALARDTRESGEDIRDALISGMSGRVVDLGVLPTPGLSALLADGQAVCGVAITASHNPWHDNGLKVLEGDGHKPSQATQDRLEDELVSGTFQSGRDRLNPTLSLDEGPGLDRYVELFLQHLPADFRLDGVHVALDAAHGAAFQSAPRVLEALGARVDAIGVSPDGRNINEGLGAVHPEVLAQRVKDTGAQVGICLDGDADRGILIDAAGRVIDGDAVLLLMARGPGVVGTVMSNAALERQLKGRGLGFRRTPVGDRHIAAELARSGWHVGGEPSGHVLLSDGLPTGDGLLSCLRVLAGGLDLQARLADWRPDPQVLINLKVPHKPPLQDLPGLALAQQRALEDGASRVLLRYSGTEPKLRVMVEARRADVAQRLAERLAEQALQEIS
jgi:phosphoglucosamine mutase